MSSDQADQYVAVELSKNPDEIADVLFGEMVTADHFSGAVLPDDEHQAMSFFLAALIHRIPQRSLERDEIVDFVERNRSLLARTRCIQSLISAIGEPDSDDSLSQGVTDALTQMQHVLDGHPEAVNVISNRLLYLCVALDLKVRARYLTHQQAVAQWLDRAPVRQLMSEKALTFMLADYLKNMDDLEESRTEYVMLIAECALLVDQVLPLAFSAVLFRALSPPADADSWLDVRQRAKDRLLAEGRWDADDDESLTRAFSRFADTVRDDDL